MAGEKPSFMRKTFCRRPLHFQNGCTAKAKANNKAKNKAENKANNQAIPTIIQKQCAPTTPLLCKPSYSARDPHAKKMGRRCSPGRGLQLNKLITEAQTKTTSGPAEWRQPLGY